MQKISNTELEYIPLSEAGRILNTSRDYMNVLVRRGKLRALKLGRNWVTTREWIDKYQKAAGRISETGPFFTEREERLRVEALLPEIKLPARELKLEEKKDILESAFAKAAVGKTLEVSEFQKVAKQLGILKSLKSWSHLKFSLASGLVGLIMIISLGLASGLIPLPNFNVSAFKNFNSLKYQASIFSDVLKNFPSDLPSFSRWLASGLNKSLSILKSKSPSELAIEALESGKSKLLKPEETPYQINTLAEAENLDSPSEALATEGGIPVGGSAISVGASEFKLLENRLSIVEANLKDQTDLINSELSLQKKTILGTLETLFGLAKFVPEHPISTIVVQGSPATLTSYSVAPQVQSGFDRLSASYLTLSNNAEINGSLTVKSGASFNSLSVSGNSQLSGGVTIGGTLAVTGDTTLTNLSLTGTLNALNSQFNLNSASTTNLTVSGNAWIANGTITNASTTYATLPTFWSTNGTITNGTITNASTTYLTVGSNFWGNGGLFTGAIQTPLIWNNGTLTASTTGSNPLIFATNSSERMRIDENGRILAATTTVPSGFGLNVATSTFVYGNQFISGGLGVGIATTTRGVLQTSGDASVGGNFYVSGNSTIAGNSTVIGGSSANTLTVNSSITSNLIPDANSTRDIGSTAKYWANVYVNTLTANSISAASTTIGGTQSKTFTIDSGNTSVDQETQTLIFFRGTVVPNALLTWNSATSSKRFEFNQALYINNGSASTTNPTLTVQTIANQTANGLQVIDNNSGNLFSVSPVGSQTTMINASTTNFTISGNLWVNNIASNLSLGGVLLLTDGTVGSPSLSFTNDTSTGLFRLGNGKMSFATNATTSLTLDNGKVIVGNDLFTASYQLEVADRDANNSTIVDELRLSHFTTGTAANGLGTGFLFYGQDSTGAGQNLARVAAQVEQVNPSNGFLSGLIFSTVGGGGLLEKMRITGNGGLALATTTIPSNFGANIATSTFVYGSLSVGTGTLQLLSGNIISGSGQFNITNAANTALTFSTNNSERMRIDNQGNVGIGTTAPTSTLQVIGTVNVIPTAGGNSGLYVNSSGNIGIGTTNPSAILDVNGNTTFRGNIIFPSTATSTLVNKINAFSFTDSSGNVLLSMDAANSRIGIGTNLPKRFLDIRGDVQFQNNQIFGWGRAADANNFSGWLQTDTNNVFIIKNAFVTGTNKALDFQDANSNSIVTMLGNDNVGIGTSTGLWARTTIMGSGSDSTTAALSVINNASTSLLFVRNDGNVGIGTTSPMAAFALNSGQAVIPAGSAAAPSLGFTADAATGLFLESSVNHILSLTENGTEVLTVGPANNYGSGKFGFTANGVLQFNGSSSIINDAGGRLQIQGNQNPAIEIGWRNVQTNTSGVRKAFLVYGNDFAPTAASTMTAIEASIEPVINYSAGGTGSYEALRIAATETALPTGQSYLIRAMSGSAGTTDRFVVTNTGNVGIGTSTGLWARTTIAGSDSTSANAALSVINSASTSLLFVRNDGNVGIGTTSPMAFFSVAGAGYFTGNVGIGISSASYPLDVRNTVNNIAGQFRVDGAGVQAVLALSNRNTAGGAANEGPELDFTGGGGQNIAVIQALWNGAATTDGYMAFFTRGSNSASERMRITSAGNVGIATTTPGAVFQAVGNSLFGSGGTPDSSLTAGSPFGSSNSFMSVMNATNNYGILRLGNLTADTDGDNIGILSFHADKQSGGANSKEVARISSNLSGTTAGNRGGILAFYTKADAASISSERMRIDRNGNVGIGTTTPGQKLSVTGNIVASGCISAYSAGGTTNGTCADIAESYFSGDNLTPADIVAVKSYPTSPEGFSVVKATSSMPVIGVVSTRPAIFMQGDSALFGGSNFTASSTFPFGSSVPLALAGRVPVKVSLENGPIAIGDRIAASSVAGVGKKASSTEATVGIALENYQTPNSNNQILVFVNLGQPQLAAAKGTGDLASMVTASNDLNMNGFSILNVKSITGINGLWKIDEGGNITAQSVNTQALTVGGGNASGVTIYDRMTTAPKCIYIEGGVIKTSDGACGQTTNAGTPAAIIQASAPAITTATATTTSAVIATTTPDIIPIATTTTVATTTAPVITSTTTISTATTTP